MKKIGNNFHRILNEEIIKFLNEATDSLDLDLREKYTEFLDDPIYAAYAGAPASGNSDSSAATSDDSDSKYSARSKNDPVDGSEGRGNVEDDSDSEESSDGKASPPPPAAVNNKNDSVISHALKMLPDVSYENPNSSLNNNGADDLNVLGSVFAPAEDIAKNDSHLNQAAPADPTQGVDDQSLAFSENKKIDRRSLSFLLEEWD